MTSIEVTSGLDDALETVPNRPAVFLIRPHQGEPYLGKTTLLRRRLVRLLKHRDRPSRMLNLRETARAVEYRLTGSALEAMLLHYDLARRHFPDRYLELLNLRMPPYVKLLLANPYPRAQVTSRLSASASLHFGPFRTRQAAERFESQFLDLFQIRRCQDDLAPSPEHPGCIYGEMSLCLRPCQAAVSRDEYAHEVARVVDFLRSDGQSLMGSVTAARDRLSQEMNFEEAARQHNRLEKIREILKLRDALVCDINRLNGAIVTSSLEPHAVELWFVCQGYWQAPLRMTFEVSEGKPVSLDKRLRDVISTLRPVFGSTRLRQEHLALLARWFYSSWREGEWVPFNSLIEMPYRRLVRAISRVAAGGLA
jgi:excinuclease UvrABC nuclease subunit